MKRIFTATWSLAVSLCLFICACKKDHKETDNDPTKPTIIITSPADNQVYANGDSIKIQGNVSDNSLHELRLKITTGNTELFSKIISVHDLTTYDFSEGWKSSVTSATNATVTVEAEDHGNHTVTKTVAVSITP